MYWFQLPPPREAKRKAGRVEFVNEQSEFTNSGGDKSGAVYILKTNSWGCTGFDVVIGRSWLRVRALFSVINEHLKRNDKSNVVYADFGAKALAA